jgi:predicted RNA-binding Zn-ribbon protein involved in translation (DUF1610 family)
MSIHRTHELTCPQCGNQQTATVWETVNVTMHPEMKEEVIQQRVNVFLCAECGEDIFVDISFLYNDMESRFCVRYISRTEMGDPNSYVQFKKDGSLSLVGPAREIAEASGGGYMFQPHCVFSMREVAAYVLFRDLCEEFGV